jgi:TolB-like protein
LQWSIGYLGAALALAHGQELIAHTFHWPELISRLVMGALIVGFPIAIVLAWYHGHKGATRVSNVEMAGLAVLLLAGGIVLTLIARSEHRTSEESQFSAAPLQAEAEKPRDGVSASVSSEAAPAPQRVRLAILPFENLSPDPANAFFADGLHEEVISAIAQRVPMLDVVSRTTMMMYRTKPMPITEMAQQLHATHVLEGSVRREARQVRLTLQLIDARVDRHIWSTSYDRTLANALTLQSEVAHEVASQLPVQLVESSRSTHPVTENPEAYDLYLRAGLAAGLLNPRSTLDELSNVQNLLTRAIALDPSFAAALAARARSRMQVFLRNFDVSAEQLERARDDLKAARKLAPDQPNVLAAEAGFEVLVDENPERAMQAIDAAELGGVSLVNERATLLARMGRIDEGLRRYQDAMVRDPGNLQVYMLASIHQALARKPAEALRTLDRAHVQFPDFPGIGLIRAEVILANTGKTDALSAWLGSSTDENLDESVVALRFAGRYEELERLLNTIKSPAIRVRAGGGGLVGLPPYFGVGDRPLAEYRGWAHLLAGKRAAAAADGREVLAFVAAQKETRWNRWFMRLLAAEGHLFAGNLDSAKNYAQQAVDLMPRSRQAVAWMSVATSAAQVFAWAGARDRAVGLLEELSTVTPGIAPAEVTRDPLFSVPLAQYPGYKRLVERLEAQMRAIQLPPSPA